MPGPRAADVILGGGLAAGLLDIVNAIVFWRLYNGASATVILQSVAAGLLGKAAFAGGGASAALGLFLHLLIMCVMAAVFWLACRRWPWMLQRPVAAGVSYGLVTWAVMNYVVLPLSRAGPRPSSLPGSSTACWPTSCWWASSSHSSRGGRRAGQSRILRPRSPAPLPGDNMNESTGKLILRVTLGVLILLHGISKLTGGIDWLDGALANAGLPAFFKYGVYVGEVLAPLAVIAGFYARIGAWLMAVNMLFAFGLAHGAELFVINPQSGGLALELQYLFFFSAIAVALIGPGRYAFNQK